MKKIIISIFSTFGIILVFLLFQNSKIPNTIETSKKKSHKETSFQEPHPDSIPAMAQKNFSGDNLRLKKIKEKDDYIRYSMNYTSEDLTISGVANIPNGKGPFPIIILNHGYIDPEIYTPDNAGLQREQDYFAKNGYAVFHPDYRNYGNSDFDPENEVRPRSGYVEDVLNLISAIKKSDLKNIDKEKIGMLGHSMGGGVTLNVMTAKPNSAQAYVLFAPINATYKKNFDRWVKTEWPELANEILQTYGTFEENPEFWNSVSASNYLEKINAPVMLFQGKLDKAVPVKWSRNLADNLKKHKKDITYHEYPKEDHIFHSSWSEIIKKTLNFFDNQLK